MKKSGSFLICVLAFFTAFSQDISLSGSFTPSEISVGSTAELKVVFNNNAYMAYAPGDVYVQVTLPVTKYQVIGTPEGTLLEYFQNFRETTPGLWFGTNTVKIPALLENGFSGAGLTFRVKGVSEIRENMLTLLATDFQGKFSDIDETDNFPFAGLVVTRALPIEVIQFEAKSQECGVIQLELTLRPDSETEYVEIMRSADGKDFSVIGKVEISSERSGEQSFLFKDDQGLITGTPYYYYQLRQVGSNRYGSDLKKIAVRYNCKKKAPEMTIFPNPAVNEIKINLTNFAGDTEVNAVILDASGKVVKKIVINSIEGTELKISDLPAGVYRIETLDVEEQIFQRFVHLK